MRLPSQAAFDLRAHTGSGQISTDHPLTLQGAVNHKELQAKVRGGGFRLNVSTASGDIHIR